MFSCLDDDIGSKASLPLTPLKTELGNLASDTYRTAPHLIDHFYGAYAKKDAMYLHGLSSTLGEDYMRKVDLQGETLSFHRADFDFSARFNIDHHYSLIRNQASCQIDKALKIS